MVLPLHANLPACQSANFTWEPCWKSRSPELFTVFTMREWGKVRVIRFIYFTRIISSGRDNIEGGSYRPWKWRWYDFLWRSKPYHIVKQHPRHRLSLAQSWNIDRMNVEKFHLLGSPSRSQFWLFWEYLVQLISIIICVLCSVSITSKGEYVDNVLNRCIEVQATSIFD